MPAHTAAAARHTASPADVLQCTWSQLQHVQELVLHNICLDSPLFAATVECQQLTALHVGGLDLQQDVRSVTGLVATGDVALRQLKVLEVDQHFNLGPNSAAVLMPRLKSLKITHAGNNRCAGRLRGSGYPQLHYCIGMQCKTATYACMPRSRAPACSCLLPCFSAQAACNGYMLTLLLCWMSAVLTLAALSITRHCLALMLQQHQVQQAADGPCTACRLAILCI